MERPLKAGSLDREPDPQHYAHLSGQISRDSREEVISGGFLGVWLCEVWLLPSVCDHAHDCRVEDDKQRDAQQNDSPDASAKSPLDVKIQAILRTMSTLKGHINNMSTKMCSLRPLEVMDCLWKQ